MKYEGTQPEVAYQDLGIIDYQTAWDLQEKAFDEIVSRKLSNREKPGSPPTNKLFFCEHPHVYTLGKSGLPSHLLLSEDRLSNINATYHKINRGGDITYHGPGQLVGYPIFDLDQFFTDIHKYLRFLEEAVIQLLLEYNIEAGRIKEYTGVWLDVENPLKARKICAMGVRCSRWVTMHGFAFNVNPDLSYFSHIVPCGIQDKSVTSLAKELGYAPDMEHIKEALLDKLQSLFGYKTVWDQKQV